MLTEDAPLRPLTPYAESKVRTEEDLAGLADDHFSPVLPSERHRVRLFSSAARRYRVEQPRRAGPARPGRIRLMSDGKAWRPIVHVQDIGRACIACLDAPVEAIHNQAINIGRNDENYR